jgi:hypothetical protein
MGHGQKREKWKRMLISISVGLQSVSSSFKFDDLVVIQFNLIELKLNFGVNSAHSGGCLPVGRKSKWPIIWPCPNVGTTVNGTNDFGGSFDRCGLTRGFKRASCR